MKFDIGRAAARQAWARVPAAALAAAAACAALPAAPAVAQATQVNAWSAAGVPVVKTVRSMRDLRYQTVVVQQFDYSCGSAALSTLLKYGYGIDMPETELIRRMMAFSSPEVVTRNGFSMLDMKKFVETIGLRGRGFRVGVDALYRLQIPVIVLMNVNGYDHFVIVKHAENGRIFIADPALGNRVLLEDDFARSWNGLVFAVIGKPLLKDSPLLERNQSLALKLREQALQTGTSPTPFVDYGLIKTDLF